MKTKKTLLINLLSTILLITLLTSCSKEKINNEEIPDARMSNELYKQKLQALITSNNSKARELGINTAVLKDTVQQSFKSYKEAYEFFAVLKKGITSAKTDSALVRKSASKNLATQATTYGVESVSFSVFCSNSCGVQATFGVGSVAAEWTVSGSLGYYWIKNSPTSPKQYQSASPSASCSTPIIRIPVSVRCNRLRVVGGMGLLHPIRVKKMYK